MFFHDNGLFLYEHFVDDLLKIQKERAERRIRLEEERRKREEEQRRLDEQNDALKKEEPKPEVKSVSGKNYISVLEVLNSVGCQGLAD